MTRDGHRIHNAEHTCVAVLEAAAEALAKRGTGASLSRIAEVAGVSKSGPLHRFANREQLTVAPPEDVVATFRQAVMQHLDAPDERPGKLMRAYVRALCTGLEDVLRYFSPTSMWAGVLDFPEAIKVVGRDSTWRVESLAADGLSPQRVLAVRRAAEGLAVVACYGEEAQVSLAEGRQLLLSLTGGGGLPDWAFHVGPGRPPGDGFLARWGGAGDGEPG